MIKAKPKPIEEIRESIERYKRVLILGCGGCVSVCLAGGQKEARQLRAELEVLLKMEQADKEISDYTVERQCNLQFLEELERFRGKVDAIISIACGAGAQLMAERFPDIPVVPGVNTVFIGIDRQIGVYEEKCRACGECVLAYTGGICPVTRCAKGLFNGPCGGTNQGMCEVSSEIPCAWYDIYNRLKEQGRLEDIRRMRSPMPWKNQIQRTIVQDAYRERYETETEEK